MTGETEETLQPLPDLDEDDMWVRGQVYVNYKHLLGQAELHIPELEHNVAQARYEHEITQRMRANVDDPQARLDWKTRESAAHDSIAAAERELAKGNNNAIYYRAMVAEIENDLGDKAEMYLEIITTLEWMGEWDEEDLIDLEHFTDEYDEFDPNDPIPF